jgi:hypothetical protein
VVHDDHRSVRRGDQPLVITAGEFERGRHGRTAGGGAGGEGGGQGRVDADSDRVFRARCRHAARS